MMAMAMLLLALSAATNLFQLQMYRKKPKPRKQIGPAPERKGLLGAKHVLERIYMDDIRGGGRVWFFECSCGTNLSNVNSNNEAYALGLWKKHVALFKEFTEEGDEIKRLTEELETFKKNCICHNL